MNRFAIETLSPQYQEFLKKKSTHARGNILRMTTVAASGHPGGSMSSIDFYISALFFSDIFEQSSDIHSGNAQLKEFTLSGGPHDAFYISHGHTSPGWYSALNAFDIVDEEMMNSGFRHIDSPFAGHVEHIIPLVSWDTGNLGQGLSAACAKALYFKEKKINSHVWVFMGDGEQQKGQISEARRFIRKFNLTNITVVIDFNKLQISGNTDAVMPQNLDQEWSSSGFKVEHIDGHNFFDLFRAYKKSVLDRENNYCILARTTMGKGVSFMENKEKYHGSTLSVEDCRKALNELGEEDNLEHFIELRKNHDFTKILNRFEEDYEANSPHPAYLQGLSKTIKDIYPSDKMTDCRSAYGDELLALAEETQDIFVFDCDLAGSVKTNGFEKKYNSRFIQTGIQEHHAATCAGSLSKEDSLVFFSDFAIFGLDETFNQQRLNDINQCNLKAVYTHAGTNVGEDGKTHHGINYIGLSQAWFHSSLLLPGDPNQTRHFIRYTATNPGNFYVVMGRSKTPIICDDEGNPYYCQSYLFQYGKPDVIHSSDNLYILSCGPAMGDAYLAFKKLNEEGIKIGLINVATPNFLLEDFKSVIQGKKLIITEDHNINNGLSSVILKFIGKHQLNTQAYSFGITDYAPSGDYKAIYKKYGIDHESITNFVKSLLH